VIKAVKLSKGKIIKVNEQEISDGRDAFGRLGFYIEPTSAIVWSGLLKSIQDLPDPVVILLTGSGLKGE
jgi:threonine synthase